MTTALAANLSAWLKRPWTLAGPVFEKELRVASRRRRSYVLRLAYVAVLMTYIALIWVPAVELEGSALMSRAQMERAARMITLGIVWFQFFGAQLVAIVMMSTAISEEVYGRTLCVLMTTPLSGTQVVLSKLASRLLQILLLVATSLPLLAIVRVLGGIPWGYLVVSLSITLTAIIFVGAVSLFFSALCRRAYLVVILSALSMVGIFVLLPFVIVVLLQGWLSEREALATFLYWNPYLVLYRYTDYTVSPRGGVPFVFTSQIVSCGVALLFAAALLLIGSIHLVRHVALRRAMGEPALLDKLRKRRLEDEPVAEAARGRRRGIRRVVGPAMVWKELTCVLPRRQRLAVSLAVGMEVVLILIAYSFPSFMVVLSYEGTHLAYLWTLLGLGSLFTLVASATVIGTERETHAWPLLLMTPLRDRDILLGKFVGVLRRCGLIWLVLLVYVAAFAGARCFYPLAVAQTAIIIASVVLFLSATGFYLGARCRRTAEAVTTNLVLAGVLWCILPMIGGIAVFAFGRHWMQGDSLAFAGSPFGQAVIMLMTTLDGFPGEVRWLGRTLEAASATAILLLYLLAYALVSLVVLWRARRAFRHHIL